MPLNEDAEKYTFLNIINLQIFLRTLFLGTLDSRQLYEQESSPTLDRSWEGGVCGKVSCLIAIPPICIQMTVNEHEIFIYYYR